MTRSIKIIGENIKVSSDFLELHKLRFLPDNPRVYACTHGIPGFNELPVEKQQDLIYKKLLEEPSVKNLEPEIKRHGGLLEAILVRLDTMEVIEGNSRLAVYRKLHEKHPGEDWELIQCDMVSKLTDEQQFAFLNQIHVKGKTQWSAYEKANLAYVRKERGWTETRIAELFGETEATISNRVKVIDLMKSNGDNDQSHFSYYEVMTTTRKILQATEENKDLKNLLLNRIKHIGPDNDDNDFTALELRNKLPSIIDKPKILKKYIEDDLTFDDAYQEAKTSKAQQRVKRALSAVKPITKKELEKSDQNIRNAIKPDIRRLKQEVNRIDGIIKSLSQ